MVDYKQLEELERWNQSVSPLTQFARSLRMDASNSNGPANDDTKSQQQQDDQDPWKGLNLDELDLDDDVKDTIAKIKDSYVATSTKASTLEKQNAEIEKARRDQQARADRYHEKLRGHNLLDGGPVAPKVDPDDATTHPLYGKLYSQFKKAGLADEAAKAYAIMQVGSADILKQDIVQSIGLPIHQQLQGVQSNQLLDHAIIQDQQGILQIPQIQESVRQSLDAVVQQGTVPSLEIIKSLRDMAFGQFALTPEGQQYLKEGVVSGVGADINMNQNNQNGGHVVRNVGGMVGGFGGLPQQRQQQQNRNQAPQAVNSDTAAAIAAVAGAMSRSVPKK